MRSEVFSETVDGMICPQCEDEIAQNTVSLKDLRKGEQLTVSAEAAADMILDDIADNLKGTILK